MLIVADENIPLLHQFFAGIGEIRAFPGRTLSAEQVLDADILLVRSVTRVNAELLEGSCVRFVGTATIGCDHVDLEYLTDKGIGFANAPGCNAMSVVEYVLSCLSVLGERFGKDWRTYSVGVVGAGNVGGRLAATLRRLGMTVKVNDPILEAQGQTELVSLDEALSCDVISLHTPLTQGGDYPTHHLIDARRIESLKSSQILINSGRGPVISQDALLERLRRDSKLQVVLDVWETEPEVHGELLERVALGTPHIAGYSLDGKMRGTEMVYQALCHRFGFPMRHKLGQFLPQSPLETLGFSNEATTLAALDVAIRAIYDVRRDDVQLRRLLQMAPQERAAAFDQLRKNYPVRREFSQVKVRLRQVPGDMTSAFDALGFSLRH